jgi:hypothetical protein
MKINFRTLMIVAGLLIGSSLAAQTQPERSARFDDGKFTLRIELSWDELNRQKLISLFELDSAMVQRIFERDVAWINDSTEWTARMVQPGMMEISKSPDQSASQVSGKDIILSDLVDESRIPPPAPVPVPPTAGVNDFSREGVFSYENGKACFTLPGYRQARSVHISGSFNQWNTLDLPMQKTNAGWEICLDLPPGKHFYKFIVDGRWMHDPNNRLREGDGLFGHNSIVYTYNHVFVLEGHQRARRVVVAGSFNNWNRRSMPMRKTGEGWELPLFLNEGSHTYKFIVDNRWMLDPGNPLVRGDGDGNTNSLIEFGEKYTFRLRLFEKAERVVLTGSFNAWRHNELVMERHEDEWRYTFVLPAGNHEYKYIVDGRWITDPSNPFTTGSGDFVNSFLALNPNHLFVLKGFEEAAEVIVTGTFNNWSHTDYRMVYRDGEWVFPVFLWPGRYSYKFIVDGKWIPDPDNPLWQLNRFGSEDSVLWID